MGIGSRFRQRGQLLHWAFVKHLERNKKIVKDREGGKTLKAIADDFGLSSQQVRAICVMMERRATESASDEWYAGLSTRAVNFSKNWNLQDRDEAIRAISGARPAHFMNVGKKTLAEVREALGIQEPESHLPLPTIVAKWRNGEMTAEAAMKAISKRYEK